MIKQIRQVPRFQKIIKKLSKQQKVVLDKQIKKLVKDPFLGEKKKGGLSFLYVYKYKLIIS